MLTTDEVGFEILVLRHLSLLQTAGVEFLNFRNARYCRQAIYDAKFAKLPVSEVYGAPTTLHHSLEALIGHIDFD